MSTVKVSIIDFRKNIYRYIRELPLAVTAKGKTLFYIVPEIGVKVTDVSTDDTVVSTHEDGEKLEKIEVKEVKLPNFGEYHFSFKEGWCQGHFERGVTYKTYLITYENENGDVTIDHKWYCEKCVNILIGKRVGKIYDS
ncbi:MAG: hypothetical protein UT24_C0016G0019 [Candidatus Woesebacteria bacterium GW2011_GWB1_39_12]|uniref:Uncharacterized protein n=1 Tax=Candidatus Woesebacteria bacterium GW2011_GWB1_39_12 TaxID=1618574 RepID=A0A0G0PPP3_9BACT|nr:MAG: hypothetical protein UT24_C0016G0019 [Candidatus Woesebacteria bacterium GW2011_GWB1_39_12]